MRLSACLAALLVALSCGLPAQPQDTFVITTFPPPMSLARFAADGTVLGNIGTLPTDYMPSGMAIAEDNRSYRLFGWLDSLPGDPFVLFDVSPQGVVTTLHLGGPMLSAEQMIRTSDGEWLFLARTWSGNLECYTFQGTTFSKLSTFGPIFTFGLVKDPEQGVLHVRDAVGITSVVSLGYDALDPWNRTVTRTYHYPPRPGLYPRSGPMHPIYDPESASMLDMQYLFGPKTSNLIQVSQELGASTLSKTLVRYPVDLMSRGGRASGFDFYLLAADTARNPGPPEIIRMKKDGTIVGKSFLNFTQRWWIWPGVLRTGSRHVDWRMDQRPNGRSLNLSFPGETGLSYAVGLSLTGIRPGVPLGDGRTIPLVPDNLTWLSLKGGVSGILEHTVGNLDMYGRARVKVDTNAFGSALKGVKIWAVALVLDPSAPAGVAHIAGPTLLSVRQ